MDDDVTAFLISVRTQAEDHPNVPSGDVLPLLAAVEALVAALASHTLTFTDSEGIPRCAGCGRVARCPDDPQAIITAALTGKEESDGPQTGP